MANDQPSSTHDGGLAERLRRDSRERIESGKRSAADHIQEVAQALDRAGAHLDQNEPTLAAYASQIAGSVGNLATKLRDGSLEELLEDTRVLARRNPTLFIAGGVVLGIALSRFLRASNDLGAQERARSIGEDARDSAYAPASGHTDEHAREATASGDMDVDRTVPEPTSDFDTGGYAAGAARPEVEPRARPDGG
jgi:hypothetical protein